MVKALVIVAHPDDETIWCGGTILMHPKWDWAILSLCRRDDTDRAPKFAKACGKLHAKCAMSDLEDDHPEMALASLGGVKARVRAMMKRLKTGKEFDLLFTHGENGEYGHNRHKETHRAVKEMLASGELSARKTVFFSYRRARSGDYCVADTSSAGEGQHKCAAAAHVNGAEARAGGADARNCGDEAHAARVATRLSARTARAKHLLITSAYQFSKGSFEARSARAVEGFKVNEHAINGTLSMPSRTGRHKHPGRNALPRPSQKQA